ncbi:MAG: hypothetical protein ACRDHZ_07520, partial [Ktedonobacteraceae bacterium]
MALDKIARITRAKLDSAANDPDGSPQARISAASDLLKFDLEKNQRVTARTERTCHSVMAKFLKYSSASLGVQRAVRTAADHLREDLETALKAQPAQPEEDDAAIPMAHPSPQSTPVAGEQPLIGGQELLPDPNNEREWTQLMVGLGHYRLLTKSELLASIDIPLWIGERETTNRKPVNIAAPGSLPIYLADSELGWKDSRDMAVEATDAARALYFAELNELVHTRLHELGIATPAGVFVPLEELSAALDVAYQKL